MAGISVLIADDHLLLRETLVHFLSREPGFSVSTAGSLAETLSRIATDGPFDVVLLDVVMPGMQGLPGVSEVVAANAGGAVVVMSGNVQRSFVEGAMQRGAKGYVPKTLPARALAEAMRQVASGRSYLPVDLYSGVPAPAPEGLSHLSPQELRVLRYLCQGLSNKEIAREMDIGEVTVKTHMRAICTKLGARNRTQAALIGTAHFRG
ncbi:response regulator [Gemmobacter nectariphilus]|uniref:response regulator n=1 Tax=Gemmobacter nectariphilus TaxID=220343 RepID=UPI0004094C9D|nr:response regulator transcription factor [Gemmobacter nectariphilus]